MHALATLILTKVPIKTSCKPIIVIVQQGCFSFCPLASALPLSKCPFAALAAAGCGFLTRPSECQGRKQCVCNALLRADGSY